MNSETGDRHDTLQRKPFYGRRKGRPLTARQSGLLDTLLPSLRPGLDQPAPVPLTALFPVPVDEVWLEVGFGGGEHVAAQAKLNPQAGIIGAEPFINGVAKLLTQIAANSLRNVMIRDDDVRPLIEWLPHASLSRVFILYPDPWPKRRHADRRIVSPEMTAALARVMKPGADLRIATDIAPYAEWACSTVLEHGAFSLSGGDTVMPPDDWVETRYEAKAKAAGRRCIYLRFFRN